VLSSSHRSRRKKEKKKAEAEQMTEVGWQYALNAFFFGIFSETEMD
jgi:hypothetical protein